MKYIEIVEYVDICSTAFVKAIDTIYDSSLYVESLDKIVINLSNKDVKEMFVYYVDAEIQAVNRKYGKKVIIVNTCTLKSNWKNYNTSIDHRLSEHMFAIKDDSLLINTVTLTKLLTRKWKDLRKSKEVVTISNDRLDCCDIINIIKKSIGEMFICRYKTPYKIIEDINNDYYGIAGEDIPNELVDFVKNTLITNKLLI